MKRTEAREQAFKLLYSLQLMDEKNIEEQLELFIQENEINDKDGIDYIKDIIMGTDKNNTEIEIIIGNEKAEGIVYDNNAGKSFLELLPLTIKMTDYNNTEKIGKVGNKINTKGEPEAYDPDKSDIAFSIVKRSEA